MHEGHSHPRGRAIPGYGEEQLALDFVGFGGWRGPCSVTVIGWVLTRTGSGERGHQQVKTVKKDFESPPFKVCPKSSLPYHQAV